MLSVQEPGPSSHGPGVVQSSCDEHIIGASGGASMSASSSVVSTGASIVPCMNLVESMLQPAIVTTSNAIVDGARI
jgi:hypothetical protein